MSGSTTEELLRIDLAAIQRRHGGIPVRFIDDVASPVDDGRYVSLMVTAGGEPVEVLVLTTADFYECLRKVMTATLPSMGRVTAS
jgi:hypothetical protein